ncbi:MAG: hypothetical protein IH977_14425 [Nitrospinae bacterium]|nr:hypothetical protein [Nitrospinota bacterium]
MNIYLVVEGLAGAKMVYAHWVPLVNPDLRVRKNIDEVDQNSLWIVGGGGIPSYYQVIKAGAEDVASNESFDRLVVAIDSEDMPCHEKKSEIEELIDGLNFNIAYRVVVQHFCLETWFLGNRSIISRNSDVECVRKYRGIYDVLDNDPELLPEVPENSLNRAQFAYKYLSCLINAKNPILRYKKNRPSFILNDKYYNRVKERFDETGHISSFGDFLMAFV